MYWKIINILIHGLSSVKWYEDFITVGKLVFLLYKNSQLSSALVARKSKIKLKKFTHGQIISKANL